MSFHDEHANADSLLSRASSISRVTGANGKRQDVEELEMLLEAYFVLVDGIIQHVASVMLLTFSTNCTDHKSYCRVHQKSCFLSLYTSEGNTFCGRFICAGQGVC